MTTLALPGRSGVEQRLRRGHGSLQLDAGRVGVRGLDLDVLREGDGALDERPRRIEGARAHAGAAAELRHLGGEGRVTSITGASFLPSGLDVERHEDGVVVRGFDGLRDRLTPIRDDVVGDAAQEDAVVAALPVHHAAAHGLAALSGADRGAWRSG